MNRAITWLSVLGVPTLAVLLFLLGGGMGAWLNSFFGGNGGSIPFSTGCCIRYRVVGTLKLLFKFFYNDLPIVVGKYRYLPYLN